MEEFRQALGQYLVGSMEIVDLEAAIDHALDSDTEAGPKLIEMLDTLHQTGRLPQQIYTLLKRRIQNRAEPESAPDDATRMVPLPQRRGSTSLSGESQQSSSENWNHPSQWTGERGGSAPIMETGSVIKERYVLEKLIGQGGMGRVFKARDIRKEEAQDRNPFIAVKILNEDFKRHPKALQALQRESRKAQDLAHPNIVTVFDFDRDGGNIFMTMELLDGESLAEFNKRLAGRGTEIDHA